MKIALFVKLLFVTLAPKKKKKKIVVVVEVHK